MNRRFPKADSTYFTMRPKLFLSLALVSLFSLRLVAQLSSAEKNDTLPLVHPLFADHIVLQHGTKVPVWGWAAPGNKITVQFGKQTKTAAADADGKWMV